MKRLSQYSESVLIITDPNDLCGKIWDRNVQIASYNNSWELKSALSDHKAPMSNLSDESIP
jgi:hypothetical protein